MDSRISNELDECIGRSWDLRQIAPIEKDQVGKVCKVDKRKLDEGAPSNYVEHLTVLSHRSKETQRVLGANVKLTVEIPAWSAKVAGQLQARCSSQHEEWRSSCVVECKTIQKKPTLLDRHARLEDEVEEASRSIRDFQGCAAFADK